MSSTSRSRRREGAPRFVFYEGPPTANGRPGTHHVLARVFKDVFPRYKTMRGHLVPRKARLGLPRPAGRARGREGARLHRKDDIERYGVAEFNAKCRESVLRYIDEWERLTERIGFWIDTDERLLHARPTSTSSRSGGRSSRSGRRACWSRATRSCPTARARHRAVEPRGGARLPRRRSTRRVFVKFPLLDEPGRLAARLDDHALDARPARGDRGRPRGRPTCRARLGDDVLILAEALVERVLGEEAEIEQRFPGSELLGLRYEPPFPYISDYGDEGPHRARRRLRLDRGRHRRRAHRRGLRRGRLPARRARTA